MFHYRYGQSQNYRYGYQGSEKDNEVAGEGNSYTTNYRQLDPRIGRWLSLDPKIRTTPWESPYMSMGSNPIWRNDPMGDKWKNPKKDKKIAQKIHGLLEKRKNQLNEDVIKFKEKGNNFLAKGKKDKAEESFAKSRDAKLGAEEMVKAQEELARMGHKDTEQEFTFKQVSLLNTPDMVGTYMDDRGVIVMEYDYYARAVHELTHGYQHLNGIKLELTKGRKHNYYDLTDEEEAYRRQYFFDSNSLPYERNHMKKRIKTSKDITVIWIASLYIKNKNGDKIRSYKGVPFSENNKPPANDNKEK